MRRAPSFLLIVTVLFLSNSCSWFYADESYRDSWRVTIDGKPMLLTYTNYYKGGKSRTDYDYFRIINPLTGEIKGEAEYDVRSSPINEKYLTAQSLLIKYEDGWECRKLKDMSLRWDKEGLITLLHKKNKAVRKAHEIKYYNDTFYVTNTLGEKFRFSFAELEGTTSEKPLTRDVFTPVVPKKYSMLNSGADSAKAATFSRVFSSYNSRFGFTAAGDMMVMEGENRKIFKVADTVNLEWLNFFPDKIWLNGDFLTTRNRYSNYQNATLAVSSGNCIFIYYHTSLNQEEDKTHVACIDLKQKKITWDNALDKIELKNDFQPKDSYAFSHILVTIWTNTYNTYVITGIDVNSGKVKWRIEK